MNDQRYTSLAPNAGTVPQVALTSAFDISVSLKRAGAPQHGGERHWTDEDGFFRFTDTEELDDTDSCAYRVDEIIGELELLGKVRVDGPDQNLDLWGVYLEAFDQEEDEDCHTGEEKDLVAAAAACWLAALTCPRAAARAWEEPAP